MLVIFGVSTSAAGAVGGFQSPSHNIGCVIASNGVRCDIAQHSWSPPPTPRSCPLDYGNGVNLAKHGRASYTCAGDTVLGIGPVLPYDLQIVLADHYPLVFLKALCLPLILGQIVFHL